MHYLSTILLTSGLAALVQGQNVINIQVGLNPDATGGPLQFQPPNVTAKVNDVVTFNFSGVPGNHSVTQSSFAAPCEPLQNGFDSGWISVAPNTTADFSSWSLTITNETAPIWFFCKQLIAANNKGPHCLQGMVGSINAPADGDKSYDNYLRSAKNFQGTPGGQNATAVALAGVGASASSPPGPAASGGSGSPPSPSPSGSGNGSGSGGNGDSGALALGTNTLLGVTALLFGIVLL